MFFMSDSDLIEVLSLSGSPARLSDSGQLIHMFDSISGFVLNGSKIVAITGEGTLGDTVHLAAPIETDARPVVDYLTAMEGEVSAAVLRIARDAISDLGTPREEWVLAHIGQALRIGAYVHAGQVFAAVVNGAGQQVQAAELDAIERLARRISGEITPYQRKAIETLITLSVHTNDICDDLVRKGVRGLDSFEFARQLRIEWEDPSGDSDGNFDNCSDVVSC